ncbi:hypothetical protein WOLCODRAFT_164278 [Wolfiporia cocos MD-104 SS10]|uniref:Ribonucleases P/MRP subunit Pop8-like domain-containing protein n=1 Tax=Wolfiporia cocos (strain MD-104) TaxID=742152 RepID=A0A2H3JW76_WOLCO|nr:hypothetical protein WOLCODRAFT_164278 [Wolfiporia cocos MD-104 SS10]
MSRPAFPSTSRRRAFSSSYHYIRLSVSPPCADVLTLRKTMQDALLQTFGLLSANTYIDVLSLAEDGSEVVVRIAKNEAAKLLAAVAAFAGSPRLSVIKESPFLPSLLLSQPLA